MNQKQAKKLRQLYKRDLGKRAQEHSDMVQEKVKEQLAKLDQLLKPAPRLLLEFIWVSLQKLF